MLIHDRCNFFVTQRRLPKSECGIDDNKINGQETNDENYFENLVSWVVDWLLFSANCVQDTVGLKYLHCQ